MPRYMLDTDISSYVMNQSNSGVLHKLQSVAVSDVCISAITRSDSNTVLLFRQGATKISAISRSFFSTFRRSITRAKRHSIMRKFGPC